MHQLFHQADLILKDLQLDYSCLKAAGVSCGGPLDSKNGLILSPPNLPDWDCIPVTKWISDRFGIPTYLQNDANACACAEWQFGAGKGLKNIVFLTFGTGMGAGLILNGQLYGGTNDLAGEVGHWRLAEDGPSGYGKPGSFEGFCSGGGIATAARTMATQLFARGDTPSFCATIEDIPKITANQVADAANSGDKIALEILTTTAQYLGRGMAILIDLLNPEAIIIGSIFNKAGHLIKTKMMDELTRECLPAALNTCKILPSALGDQIGDIAALAVANQQPTNINVP